MKTIQIRSLIAIIGVFLYWLVPSSIWASEQVDGIYYKLNSEYKTACVTSGSRLYDGDVVIPANFTYEGIQYEVTCIDAYAFSGCSRLTSIDIPNSVTDIGYRAFALCTGLKSVVIPNSVTWLDEAAFKGCTGMTSVTISNSLTYIAFDLFGGCTSMTSVDIPNSVKIINPFAFTGCTSLTSVNIPGSMTTIGAYAFNECDHLRYITMEGSIPPALNESCSFPFEGNTFENIHRTVVYVPAGSKSVYESAEGWKDFDKIVEYGVDPYIVCTGPCGADFYDERVIFNIYSDMSLVVSGTGAMMEFDWDVHLSYNGSSWPIKKAIIEEGVTRIGRLAFYDSYCLNMVSISKSVTSIGENAFSGCAGLASIIVESEIPASLTNLVFSDVNKNTCILYVPFGSKSVYESAQGWNEFKNIVEMDTDIFALDNAIYVEQVEGRIGSTMDIPVKMKNDFDVRGFQFTMELPEGATINGWTLTQDRMPSGTTMNNVFSTESVDGNKISVVCALNDGDKTFTGNDGEIAKVNVTFADDMEVGNYPAYLTRLSISDASSQSQLVLSDVKSTLVLDDYDLGDTNGDGMVLVGDVIAILNYIVGNAPENFNEKAADVNGDGQVLVGDVIAVLNIIVSQ